jgi:hypothetical protein
VISEDNKKRIKELLVNLQKEKLEGAANDSQVNFNKVTECFTNILFEALQFVQVIPNVIVQELKEE